MFSSKSRDEKTRDWRLAVDRYISLHKFLKDVGKVAIDQARVGGVSTSVQEKLAETLKQIDKAHSNLKKSFKPCFKDIDVKDLYQDEGGDVLTLKSENDSLQRQLIESKYENIIKVQENEQASQKHCKSLLDEKNKLEDKVKELTRELQNHVDSEDAVFHNKKQNELEETLKIKNDLIYDLKQQLADVTKERDLFRTLNKNLLRKNYHEDYSNRSTLRVEEAVGELKKLEIRFPSLETLSPHPEKDNVVEHLMESFQKENANLENIEKQEVERKNIKTEIVYLKGGDENHEGFNGLKEVENDNEKNKDESLN